MFCLDVNATAARWTQNCCGRNNLGGKQIWRDEQETVKVVLTESPKTAKFGSAPKLLVCGVLWFADPFLALGEGRCPMGRNRQEHHGRHRGTGAFNQRKLCRDNIGRNHLPAGADSNLQGLSV